jgi:NADPH-dependent ferric siderophore reductase
MIVPDMFDSYLLIGDETALPAIARRLEELPANRRAQVVVEIEDAAERQALTSQAQVEVIWVLRGEQSLLDVTRQLTLPEGNLYAWVATESALSRKVRRVLLDELKLDEAAVKAAGYWRQADTEEE